MILGFNIKIQLLLGYYDYYINLFIWFTSMCIYVALSVVMYLYEFTLYNLETLNYSYKKLFNNLNERSL